MLYRLSADLLVLLHLGFIVFVLFGGFLVLKWQRLIYWHIPAAVWGALIEFQGWICPLTPLEQQLRRTGGQAGYTGGYVEHYIIPLIYPAQLTPQWQTLLGIIVIVINLVAYGWYITRLRHYKKIN